MANILLPSKRVITPGKIPEINRKNPLSDSLLFAYVPGCGQFDAVLRQQMLVNRREVISKNGYCTDPTHASAYTEVPAPANATSPTAIYERSVMTIVAVLRQSTETNSAYSFVRGQGSSGPSWGVGLSGGTFDGPLAAFGTYTFTPTTSDNTLVGNTHVVVLTADGTTASLYLDGQLVDSGSYTGPTFEYGSHRTVIVGSNGLAGGNNTENYLSVLFDRALTESEVWSISENPWQIFKPQSKLVYFNAAAGGTVSISSAALSVAAATGELSTSLNISGSSASIASIAGTPTLTISLSASALAQSLALGLLSQGLSISGDMSAQSTVSGNVSQDVFIEGSATGQSAASGQIGIQLNIAGSSISEAFASGVISGGSVSSISGAASGVSAASGSVGLNIPIAGNASAQSNISGSVGVNIPVSGVSASVSSITGALTIDGLIYIDGSALSNAQSSGLISLTIPLSGTALAVAYASGIAMTDVINADYACLHGTVSRLTMVETSVNHLTNLTTRVNYVARC